MICPTHPSELRKEIFSLFIFFWDKLCMKISEKILYCRKILKYFRYFFLVFWNPIFESEKYKNRIQKLFSSVYKGGTKNFISVFWFYLCLLYLWFFQIFGSGASGRKWLFNFSWPFFPIFDYCMMHENTTPRGKIWKILDCRGDIEVFWDFFVLWNTILLIKIVQFIYFIILIFIDHFIHRCIELQLL